MRPNLPPVLGTRQELEQVLLNLLVNAWHAMPGGGTITIMTERRDAQALIAITDTGCGIPEEHMSQSVRAIFHHEAPGARHRAGTGRGVSADHRARRPYRHRQSGQPGDDRHALPSHWRKGSPGCLSHHMSSSSMINPRMVALIKRWLGRAGYHVTGVTTVQEAIEVLTSACA